MPFDLQVFNKQTYTAMTEKVSQDVEKFNAASGNAIQLINKPFEGDFHIEAAFASISDLVRRRNVYGNSTLEAKSLQQLLEIAVKIAAGTPPIEWKAAEYNWVLQNPALAALKIGEQLAKAKIADMLNAGISAGAAAISGQQSLVHGDGTDDANLRLLNKGAGLFGDRQNAIRAWVMHSATITNMFDDALKNTSNLFTYDGVSVMKDPFGRIYVVTDAPALVGTGGTEEAPTSFYKTLGLVEGGVIVNDSNDFNAVIVSGTGKENIVTTYQAEWSYGVAVKGYKWDTANGGKSPSDAAIATPTNWDLTASSVKDTAGVLVLSK